MASIMICMLVLVLACICRTADAEGAAPMQALIERIVAGYWAYGARDERALAELSAADPALADQWTRILDCWEAPVTVNAELPDGLPEDDTLCLAALGFQLNPDGTMREELIERLKVLRAASEKYPNAVIVCTGGGTAADAPAVTEAGRMADWLEADGVQSSRILVEDRSLTTAQNAMYTLELLEKQRPQVRQIAIISSSYHIATGTLLFDAEAVLRSRPVTVVSNASWLAPNSTPNVRLQAGALIELSGDVETAHKIYGGAYDIHQLPIIEK